MITLPNDCRCSPLKVNPRNWESLRASVKKDWFIYYRFYDPQHRKKFPKGKLRIIKGMNETKNVSVRQNIVRALIQVELNELKNLGYNPITERHVTPVTTARIISPDTFVLDALRLAFTKADYKTHTHSDIKTVLRYVEQAVIHLQFQFQYISIKDIKASHIMLILEQCAIIKQKKWSNNQFNVYVKYLSILFSQLLQYQAVEYNPLRGIRKKKTIKKLRKVLSLEERQKIDEHIKEFDEHFWRFIHIFFHSGSRTTEILRVQGEHVDLKRQKVQYLLLKGQQYEWVERTIKDVALPLWEKAMENCSPKEYVFSEGLKPGPNPIDASQISRRWRTQVKKKLGINCDFYSLKHLNTNQISALMGIETASAHNSHKSTNITMTYAVNEKERMHERLKGVNNGFI